MSKPPAGIGKFPLGAGGEPDLDRVDELAREVKPAELQLQAIKARPGFGVLPQPVVPFGDLSLEVVLLGVELAPTRRQRRPGRLRQLFESLLRLALRRPEGMRPVAPVLAVAPAAGVLGEALGLAPRSPDLHYAGQVRLVYIDPRVEAQRQALAAVVPPDVEPDLWVVRMKLDELRRAEHDLATGHGVDPMSVRPPIASGQFEAAIRLHPGTSSCPMLPRLF